MPQFLEWEKEMLHTNDWEVRGNAVRKVKNYLLEEIESRRQNPRDDYITKILSFEVEGRLWTDEEVLGHGFNRYLGGLDPVPSLLGHICTFLAAMNEHQTALRNDPAQVVRAVEQFMLSFSPVTTFQIAQKEI